MRELKSTVFKPKKTKKAKSHGEKTVKTEEIGKIEKTEKTAEQKIKQKNEPKNATEEKGKKRFFIAAGVGALGGFINGFFGGGGGMIIVPLLIYVLKYERKKAHASCIAVILPVSVISGIIYLFGGKLNGFNLLPASLGVFIGGIAGALLLKKIKAELLGYVFCVIMAIAGLKMIF